MYVKEGFERGKKKERESGISCIYLSLIVVQMLQRWDLTKTELPAYQWRILKFPGQQTVSWFPHPTLLESTWVPQVYLDSSS